MFLHRVDLPELGGPSINMRNGDGKLAMSCCRWASQDSRKLLSAHPYATTRFGARAICFRTLYTDAAQWLRPTIVLRCGARGCGHAPSPALKGRFPPRRTTQPGCKARTANSGRRRIQCAGATSEAQHLLEPRWRGEAARVLFRRMSTTGTGCPAQTSAMHPSASPARPRPGQR